MQMIKSYKQLVVWQKSMELVSQLYAIIKQFPPLERQILIPQMLRAGISIPSNIAEGFKRVHTNEYRQFLNIANASAGELETQLLISKEQYKHINYDKAEQLCLEIQKMLHTIIHKL